MGEGGEANGKSTADFELSVAALRRKTSDRGKHMCLRHMPSSPPVSRRFFSLRHTNFEQAVRFIAFDAAGASPFAVDRAAIGAEGFVAFKLRFIFIQETSVHRASALDGSPTQRSRWHGSGRGSLRVKPFAGVLRHLR
jgi:hypothetical protein